MTLLQQAKASCTAWCELLGYSPDATLSAMFAARCCCAVGLMTAACGSSTQGDDTDGAAIDSSVTSSAGGASTAATITGSGNDDTTVTTSGLTASGVGGSAAVSTGGAGASGSGATSSSAGTSQGGGSTSVGGSTGNAGTGGSDVTSGTPTHEELAALPMSRQEHGAAALNGEIYVLGGFTAGGNGASVLTSVQAYNPETDSWRDVADFPAEFHHPNVAVVNGLLYVAGFHVGSSLREADPRVFAYDPAADEWTPRAPLPTGTERGTSCVATLGTTIYLFGGASDMTLPDASAYDTVSDTWEVLPVMPELREHCLAAGIDGKVYIVSGRSGGIQGLEVESWSYDPATETYEERAPIPTPRGGAAGGVLGGRIFVLGGEGNANDPERVFHEVEAYDPQTDTWESFPEMLIARHGYAGAVLGDRLYLPGGATREGFGATDHHTVFFFEPAD